MTMKAWINKKLCRLFGCITFTERWGIKYIRNGKSKYRVVERCTCSRCNKITEDVLDTNLSRAEMLKKEWFITNF